MGSIKAIGKFDRFQNFAGTGRSLCTSDRLVIVCTCVERANHVVNNQKIILREIDDACHALIFMDSE